jgi:exonuclease SbcD
LLTEDQARVLEQLVTLIRDWKPHVVVVAGDVYDRAAPPAEAVALLSETLARIVLDLKVPVIMIAGNHDSPERLQYASPLLAREGLYMVGDLTADPVAVTLRDDHGPVHFYALPYAEPPLVRERLGDASLTDHNRAMRALIDRVRAAHPVGERSVVIAHAFVAGSTESESERPLSVGGSAAVEPGVFRGFDYVALGHLHRPQRAGADYIQYAGSLLKYSFSEADHQKAVTLVELNEQGLSRLEQVFLAPRRDVRVIKGRLAEILRAGATDPRRDDYLLVDIVDTDAILDPMGKLREVYPNVLHLERSGLLAAGSQAAGARDYRKLRDSDLFAAFYRDVTGEDLSPKQAAAYAKVVERVRAKEREAAS